MEASSAIILNTLCVVSRLTDAMSSIIHTGSVCVYCINRVSVCCHQLYTELSLWIVLVGLHFTK